MKAKVIDICYYNKTRLTIGEIVEIVPGMETDSEGIWNAPAGKLFLCKKKDGTFAYSTPQDLQLLLEESNDTDWSAFRRDAAKEILAGMLSHQRILYDESLRPEHVRMAISYTDELIKQLRENEK